MPKHRWPPVLCPVAVSSDTWDTAGFSGRLQIPSHLPCTAPSGTGLLHFGAPDLSPNCSPSFALLIPLSPQRASIPLPAPPALTHLPISPPSRRPPHFPVPDTRSSPLLTQERLLEATLCQLLVLLIYEEFTVLQKRCGDSQLARLHTQHALNHEATALLLTQATRR